MGLNRKEVIIDEKEAVSWIKSGMTIALGGLVNTSYPMPIIRQIIKQGIRDLTVIGTGSGGLDLDLLIAAGCVKKVIANYMGAEQHCSITPFFRVAAQKGELEIFECDEHMVYWSLRAAALGLPFMPTKVGVGSSFPEINPEIKVFNDPINEETLLAIPAIKPDVFITHAAISDPFGNVQHSGTGFGDRTRWKAADKTIVTVEKIVPNEVIRRKPIETSLHSVDGVIRAPFGAHPFSSPGYYKQDVQYIREYVSAGTEYIKSGERTAFEKFLKKYIFEPETHLDYLEVIGIKNLLSLNEF